MAEQQWLLAYTVNLNDLVQALVAIRACVAANTHHMYDTGPLLAETECNLLLLSAPALNARL